MDVLLGGVTSILYGVADFLGGEAAKKVTAATVVVWAGILSIPLLILGSLLIGGDPEIRDYAIGVAAGFSGAFGLVMLFAGLASGRAAVVAPLSAALGAMVPVVVSVIAGDRLPASRWVGIAIAIPAIAMSAWVDDDGGSVRKGIFYGSVSGAGFGGYASIIRLTDPESGMYPLVSARSGLILLVAVVSALGIWRVHSFAVAPRSVILANSVLDATANITLLLALRAGSLAKAAVAASFYPAVTVMLAARINGEHLLLRQRFGIVMTLVSLVLIGVDLDSLFA